MPAPFHTRAALHAWLEAEGLSHLARLNLEALAPRLERALWPQLRTFGARRRLTELASQESREAATWLPAPLRERLAEAAWEHLEGERAAVGLARACVPRRLEPPSEPRARVVHQRLLTLRARFPQAVAPRGDEALPLDALRFEPSLPGFRFQERLPSEQALSSGGGFARAKVVLGLLEGSERLSCSCGFLPCVHALAAVDTALRWLRETPEEAALVVLTLPAWQRALAAMDAALVARPPTTTRAPISWRVEVDEAVQVSAFREGRALRRKEAQAEAAHEPLLSLLPEPGEPASWALLNALVGHPRVFLAQAPELPVRVERAEVGLVAEDRLGAVRVGPSLEGAPMPPHLAERVRQAPPGEPLFLWDEGPRQLTLLEVKPELRAALEVLAQAPALFPPESHPALLEALSKWAQRIPVAMPRSVLGEAVPPQLLPVLRLEAQRSGAVELEVRVRALPEAPAQLPGEGPRDVHLRRGERALHAVRELGAEVALATALCAELPLGPAEVLGPFRYRFEAVPDALALVEAAGRRAAPPALEWVGQPVRSLGSTGPRALQVKVQHHLEWFGLLGGLSVEGERVELARLIDAARRKAKYVQVQGHTWVELSEVLRAHLERVADHTRHAKHGLELGPAAADALRDLARAGAGLESDAQWDALTRKVEAAQALEPKVPRALKATLRPYQRDGFAWAARLAAWGAGGVLADDMGLGKTVQALAVLVQRAALGPALVVAPTSVAFNWQAEAARFAPGLRVHQYGELADRRAAFTKKDVVIISYGLLVRDAEQLAARNFSTVIFDEAQQLKNAATQRFRAAKGLSADFRLALTGTPIENHLGELWSLFSLVFPRLLGSWERFRDQFAQPIELLQDPAAAASLARVIGPFLLRRTKAEVAGELPPRTEVRVPVVLSAPEWQLYEDTRLAALSDLETPRREMKAQERRVQVLALLTRLRLAAAHPRLLLPDSQLPSSRLARLLELLEELRAEGQRALVFSQFTSHLALVAEALTARGVPFITLDGGTTRSARAERVRQFQEGDAPVFLLSLKAGGVGLNLTGASNVILLDPWWNPAVEDQAGDRTHRFGQRKPVTIYRLVAVGTVEEQMLALHAKKRALIARVLEGTAQRAKVDTETLVGLLRGAPAP